MGRITARRRVTRITVGSPPSRREDMLAAEEPLEIRVGGPSARRHDAHARPRRRARRGVPRVRGRRRIRRATSRAARYCAGATDEGLNTYNVLDVTLGPRCPRARPEPRTQLLHDELVRAVRQGEHRRRAHALAAIRWPRTTVRRPGGRSWRRSRTGCASTRTCSTRPAACTRRRSSTSRPASCSCCARTSAGTTRSTR